MNAEEMFNTLGFKKGAMHLDSGEDIVVFAKFLDSTKYLQVSFYETRTFEITLTKLDIPADLEVYDYINKKLSKASVPFTSSEVIPVRGNPELLLAIYQYYKENSWI